MSMTAIDPAIWVSRAEARRRAGLSLTMLHVMVSSGRVRTLALPGISVKYRAEDLDSLAAANVDGREPSTPQHAALA